MDQLKKSLKVAKALSDFKYKLHPKNVTEIGKSLLLKTFM
jgi:hypothetical protein